MISRRTLLVQAAAAGTVAATSVRGVLGAPQQPRASQGFGIPGDVWANAILSNFDPRDIDSSAQAYFNRIAPMYLGASGYKGLKLLAELDSVVKWTGHYDQPMAFADDLGAGVKLEDGRHGWVDVRGPLRGTTARRMREAVTRFQGPVVVAAPTYGKWTYADLKRLIEALRNQARQYGILDFKVMINQGFTFDPLGNDPASWSTRHPEVFIRRKGSLFPLSLDPAAPLKADPGPYGGLKKGIPEGMPFTEFYTAQWASFSKDIGVDGVFLGTAEAGGNVPLGPGRPLMLSPAEIDRHTRGWSTLIRQVKQVNPSALVAIGNEGSSAIGDLRCYGLDLEAIAHEGFLDMFHEHTWGGHWNEVGVYQTFTKNGKTDASFWSVPKLGYTYQLANMLTHAAMLAGTRVRHYFQLEALDPVEMPNTIYTAPERLRWEIWAYAHCAVKTPQGLKFPDGFNLYAARGRTLLSEEDIRFIGSTAADAMNDARQTVDMLGPTLVYSRSAMKWEADHAGAKNSDIKEWIDDQLGSVAKWPVLLCSSTRVEWLAEVKSDLFIIQTPNHLEDRDITAIKSLVSRGQPLVFVGDTHHGIDARLAEIAGLEADVSVDGGSETVRELRATSDLREISTLVRNIPRSFGTASRFSPNVASKDVAAIYSIEESPALVVSKSVSKNIAVWDPPDLWAGPISGEPLSAVWHGDGSDYALMAGVLTYLLGRTGRLRADHVDLQQTVNVTAWHLKDGSVRMMAGNLEEGLRNDSDLSRHCVMRLPERWAQGGLWVDQWSSRPFKSCGGKLSIDLPQAASILLVSMPS